MAEGKERPILFSGPMVRALLDGRKTQTRRIVKGMALSWLEDGFTPQFVADPDNSFCPYGHSGDRLWVKERLARAPDIWTYVADGSKVGWPARQALAPKRLDYSPSIHMPKAASRLTLEITDVRIERLNDCSEADAMAEGTQEPSLVPIIGACWSERDAYAKLWEHINGPGSWAANPWVWVVSFNVHRATAPMQEGE